LNREIAERIFSELQSRRFDSLIPESIEAEGGRLLGELIRPNKELYEPLLLATASLPKRWYDWNIGFILPHLKPEWIIEILADNQKALAKSEGVAWALGELGRDDKEIVDFLYSVCEQCLDYDAWWCAAESLERLRVCDATDLKKRTLRGNEWNDLQYCLDNLDKRPAVIGVLRGASLDATRNLIIPKCREALKSTNKSIVQNAVWLLERLRVDDDETLNSLLDLYDKAEDISHSLRPRIVEALGTIAAPITRPILENALTNARYYRTRAYAAKGLGKIGDSRSIPILEKALIEETDPRVIQDISEAIYSIRILSKRLLNQHSKDFHWPETGMIADITNDWYANPEIYDKFSYAEDPLSLALEIALAMVPKGAEAIVDLGTGTGRFAIFAAERRPDIMKIYALDLNKEMLSFLDKKLKYMEGIKKRITLVEGDMNALPFPNAFFDAAISSWGFPSNMWNPDICLKQLSEVRRVLKEGGKLITVGWDETFRDELSELWYRFVPEPDFRRESFDEWRRRRLSHIKSPRNCYLTFVKTNLKVPLLFENPMEAAFVLGHLFGFSAGEWVSHQQRCEFSISVGITMDTTSQLDAAIIKLKKEIQEAT
jgi:ubiquinone/menaquinone biosynthesis C-methylase UbiE